MTNKRDPWKVYTSLGVTVNAWTHLIKTGTSLETFSYLHAKN